MVTRLRCGARSILWVLVLLVLMPSGTQAHRPATAAEDSDRGTILAGHRASEVRLRKLHLVRPDLIPYPIALEVYC